MSQIQNNTGMLLFCAVVDELMIDKIRLCETVG
jgi:hypothetical protein